MTVCSRPRDHIGDVLAAVTHQVSLHPGQPCKDDLAAGRVALGVSDTLERTGSHSCAVKNNARLGVCIGCLNARQNAAHEPNSMVVFQSLVEELNVLGGINSYRRERDAKGCSRN